MTIEMMLHEEQEATGKKEKSAVNKITAEPGVLILFALKLVTQFNSETTVPGF